VFEKALQKFHSYTAEKAALSTWVFRIARNTLIDHYRVHQRRKTVPLDDMTHDPEDSRTPEQTVIAKEETLLLRSCISRLSEKEQEIISLKFGGDFSNRQIAGMLGLSDSNVGVILYRAIRKLRNDFQECGNG
jgi:RNA polymerase sigma factor (sigma-70 family)